MERFYHTELAEIQNHLIKMGNSTVEMVENAVQALEEMSLEHVARVLTEDDLVDSMDVRIDNEAVRYITLRSPVASDVRFLMVAMKISNDFERAADEACSIAKRARQVIRDGKVADLHRIPEMGRLACVQLRQAIESYIDQNVETARNLPASDKKVDTLNTENFAYFANLMETQKTDATTVTNLMFISKSLERVGDHAANIAEEVVYLLSGKDIRHTDLVRRQKDPE